MSPLEKNLPTMSETSKMEFLQFCRLLLKGEVSESEFPQVIDLAKNNLQKLRNDFLADLNQLTAPVRENANTYINDALSAMDAYSNGLSTVQGYLPNRDQSALTQGMEMIALAIERLNNALHRFRVVNLAALGPTDMPNYNLFAKAVTDLRDKKINPDLFKKVVQNARASGEQMLLSFEKHTQHPEVNNFLSALQKHQKLLDYFDAKLESGEPLEEVLVEFRGVCESIRNLRIAAQMKLLTAGPTPSAAANFILNVSTDLMRGSIDPKYFDEALKQLIGEYEHFKTRLNQMNVSSTESPLIEEAIAESHTGIEWYEEAIAKYHAYQETRDMSHLSEANKKLFQAVKQLHEVYQKVSTLAEREGKVLCIRCSFYNSSDRKVCEKCGAVLIRKMGEESDPGSELRATLRDIPMTENIKTLLEAAQMASQGTLDDEAFAGTINWMEGLIQQGVATTESVHQKEVLALKKKPNHQRQKANEDAYTLFQDGVGELKEGLDCYQRFLSDRDENHIRNGSQHVLLGAQKIHQSSSIPLES